LGIENVVAGVSPACASHDNSKLLVEQASCLSETCKVNASKLRC